MSETKTVQSAGVEIREVSSIEEYDTCIKLQREAFGLPDVEISPRRHLIVSRMAGGWTLGAFIEGRLMGFVHHMAAAHGDRIFGYSHMMAVAAEYQNRGVGAQLKWAQRARALAEEIGRTAENRSTAYKLKKLAELNRKGNERAPAI